jgi:adenylate cyclase
MITACEILAASILIVDDQESNILLLEQMLRGAGYTCITSTMNPQRGVRAASQASLRPDPA